MKCREAIVNERYDMDLLVDVSNPRCVFREVKNIISMSYPTYDFGLLEHVFTDTVMLFNGEYPGYKKCNTPYHDLRHTTEVFLAMARLIHGFHVDGYSLPKESAHLGLVSALMHDTGYIQSEDDNDGTGSKYTLIHVERSIRFMNDYFRENRLAADDYEKCSRIVLTTSHNKGLEDIPFESENEEMMGRIIFTADLLSQMADRLYLEKLFLLYREFIEGNIPGYLHENDFFEKTVHFNDLIWQRLQKEMGYRTEYMTHHFDRRWNIGKDLYAESTGKNIIYLKYLLDCCKGKYRDMLKRGGVVDQLNNPEFANA